MSVSIRPFTRADEAELRRVMAAALEHDRYPGFSAWDMGLEAASIVGFAGSPAGAVVAAEDGVVCGYASYRHDDLTVHPDHRRRGIGRRLLAAELRVAAAAGEDSISLGVPAAHPGRAFAEAMGMTYRASLWRLDLPAGTAMPAPEFPAAVVARPFGSWLPLQRYVDLHNAAFATHPTNATATVEAITHAHSQPSFEPDDILILSPADSPEDPIGFVRAVIEPPEREGGSAVGEIRVLGVLPAWQGRGLGRELLRWGGAHVRARGAELVHLTVDADNPRALELYRRNGFEPAVEWPHWTIAVTARIPGTEQAD